MNSVLHVTVSCFANYTTAENPVDVNLLQWLTSNKYQQEVEHIRTLQTKPERDIIKSTLPAITPSGTFSQRGQEHLLKHSGFLQFDIDWKENKHITNYQNLKQQICHIPNVAYCGLSVSGTGFWGLVPIAYPDKHRQHFESLEKAFAHFGIIIDPAPKNVASLRGYSYDPEPYYNHQAAVYQVYEQPAPKNYPRTRSSTSHPGGDRAKVEACITEIERYRADLTGTYAAWFEIGCSLANAFREDGREYFHRVSQFHPHYSLAKTDRQYRECLKGSYRYTLATFLDYCAQAQIRYKESGNWSTPKLGEDIGIPQTREAGFTELDHSTPNWHMEPPQPPPVTVEEFLLQYAPPVEDEEEEEEEEEIVIESVRELSIPVRASIYQREDEELWDIDILDEFFSSTTLPAGPVQLYPWTKITDTALFVTSHLSYLKANNGKRSALPHLERLEHLKTILQNNVMQPNHTPLLHAAA